MTPLFFHADRRMLISLSILFMSFPATAWGQSGNEHFEKNVRPLILAKCISCHGPEKTKGGLRFDSVGLANGGNSGPAVIPGKPEESLLIRSVRHQGDLKMPPNGKLKDSEIDALATWIKSGADWPMSKNEPKQPVISKIPQPLSPDDSSIKASLQAWYRTDTLKVANGNLVHVWPDSSGKGRDLAATMGVRTGGVGSPGSFVASSTIYQRPAVRFAPETGYATSPDLKADINGNAALTIFLVMNLKPTNVSHPHDGVVGIGNPANPGGDPGKPLAYLVQISRTPDAELKLAGGWNHDATLGKGSFTILYDRPVLISIVKTPGPMSSTTKFFINGLPSDQSTIHRLVGGSNQLPDIQHRNDIGIYLGKALDWCGSIRGDIGELAIYNSALPDQRRTAVEMDISDRNGFVHPAVLAASKATFTQAQKQYWAFQPVKSTTPPTQLERTDWIRTPIDRFILAKLESNKLSPAPMADKRSMIRRITFDLIGLPPTPAEVEAYLRDESTSATDKLIDRLLASPHYGERWGRHWLDVVRYAESTANDANAVMRYAWRYRDYVVKSFNDDKPYDRFIIEQLAGDLLSPSGNLSRDAEAIIGTGYLMIGPKALAETDKEQSRRDIIDDQLDTTGRAFLGMTIGCARCHDHKFDPIPATDYYSLAGIFRGTEVFMDENRNATMWQEWPLLHLPGDPPIMIMAPKEGKPTNLKVALRGNYQSQGVLAPRRFLQIISGEGHEPLQTTQSGRLEFAKWIASPTNPLTARVMVNRIWQHHFGVGLVATSDNFGSRGEKPTHPELLDWLAAEFVSSGWSVKHIHRLILKSAVYQTSSKGLPEATKADANNRLWSRSNRRRLDAETMRDSIIAVSGKLDPTVGGSDSGELLFKEAENIGAKIRPNRVQTDHPIFTNSHRRSLYLPVIRNAVPDVIALFDGADPNGVTTQRNDTTVASQALFMLNHPLIRDHSKHFAARLLADAKLTEPARVQLAYQLSLSRQPSAEELKETLDFLAMYKQRVKASGQKPEEINQSAWRSFCQTLFCRNEFLYLD